MRKIATAQRRVFNEVFNMWIELVGWFEFQLQKYTACYTRGPSSIYENDKRDSNGLNRLV